MRRCEHQPPVSSNFYGAAPARKGPRRRAQFGPMFAVSGGCATSCACFRRNFTGGATRRTCAVWRPLVISELIECGCRLQPRPAQAEEQSADTPGRGIHLYHHAAADDRRPFGPVHAAQPLHHGVRCRFGETPYARIVPAGWQRPRSCCAARTTPCGMISSGFPSPTAFANAFRQGYRPHAGRIPRYAAV